jgi:DNA-binding transcriptional LysR family regulator
MLLALSPLLDVPATPIHPKNLNFEDEILLNWGPEFSQWHDTWCNPNISPAVQVDNVTMVLQFLREGRHWSVLPRSVFKELQLHTSIHPCPLTESLPDRVCYKLTHRFPKRPNTASIKLFEKKLAAYLKILSSQDGFYC